jgi:hypothetical protein
VSYLAVVAEVQADDKGGISVPRIDIAIDCGPQINPERIRSQLEGAVIMGMSNAMLSEITFKDGRVVQSNFDGYEVARMDSVAARGARAPCARDRLHAAARRCRRTRCAARGTGTGQRHRRRDRKAHPPTAHAPAAGGIM